MFKRDFLKFLGLIPVGVMGAAAGAAASAPKKEPKNNGVSIKLSSFEDSPTDVNGIRVYSMAKEKASITMSVGEDGQLWIKQNGEWKRVVTE